MKKNRPRHHHFVPVWYLNGFTENDSDYLNLYDKKTGFWRRQRPKEVMTITHYYRQLWVPKGIDPDVLEHFFANEVENRAKIVFEKLLNHSDDITADDGAVLLHHLELQHLRVPRYAELARDLIESMLLMKLPAHVVREVLLGNLKIRFKESLRFDAIHAALGSLIPYFSHMYWKISEAEAPHRFITSDNPITFSI